MSTHCFSSASCAAYTSQSRSSQYGAAGPLGDAASRASSGTSQFLETCSEVKVACQPCLIEHVDLTALGGGARFGWRRVGAGAGLGQVGGVGGQVPQRVRRVGLGVDLVGPGAGGCRPVGLDLVGGRCVASHV